LTGGKVLDGFTAMVDGTETRDDRVDDSLE